MQVTEQGVMPCQHYRMKLTLDPVMIDPKLKGDEFDLDLLVN